MDVGKEANATENINHSGKYDEADSQEYYPLSLSSQTDIDSGVMVFSKPLVRTLNKARLPANFVGVRRLRPLQTTKGRKGKIQTPGQEIKLPKIVYKVSGRDGQERRMTRQEKREHKRQFAFERKQRELEKNSTGIDNEKEDASQTKAFSLGSENRYHTLPISSEALEEEIADLKDQKGAVPPVFLSRAVAFQARGILPGTSSLTEINRRQQQFSMAKYDRELSVRWAKELKNSMLPAEATRCQEEMRPMAYNLIPEEWIRLRPVLNETMYETMIGDTMFESSSNIPNSSTSQSTFSNPNIDWAIGVCRPAESQFDADVSLVFQYLHQQQTGFHISCGAKFGCDFLVYDGKREERHAFAGMRVLLPSSAGSVLPLPTSYSLAGYVRCLNTAGKLAVLATVVRDTVVIKEAEHERKTSLYRIAFVDVALEKVMSKKRRDVGKNLSKK